MKHPVLSIKAYKSLTRNYPGLASIAENALRKVVERRFSELTPKERFVLGLMYYLYNPLAYAVDVTRQGSVDTLADIPGVDTPDARKLYEAVKRYVAGRMPATKPAPKPLPSPEKLPKPPRYEERPQKAALAPTPVVATAKIPWQEKAREIAEYIYDYARKHGGRLSFVEALQLARLFLEAEERGIDWKQLDLAVIDWSQGYDYAREMLRRLLFSTRNQLSEEELRAMQEYYEKMMENIPGWLREEEEEYAPEPPMPA